MHVKMVGHFGHIQGLEMATATLALPDALRRAFTAYNDGKLSQAEQLCRAIIVTKADLFQALHLLAAVKRKLGRRRDALASHERALATRPDHAEALNNRGVLLQELKRFDEALASYDKTLASKPDHVVALTHRSGILL